jgi:hypothetical protein
MPRTQQPPSGGFFVPAVRKDPRLWNAKRRQISGLAGAWREAR